MSAFIEDMVINLELAKKLHALGVEQKSWFYWDIIDGVPHGAIRFYTYSSPGLKRYSAFISDELMQKLPNRITTKDNDPFNSFRLRIEKTFFVDAKVVTVNPLDNSVSLLTKKDIYLINYYCDSTEVTGEDAWLQRQLFDKNIKSEKLCDALALTLICLDQNGLINIVREKN